MSLYDEFLCGAAPIEHLVQDAQARVRWAAEPVIPGKTICAQILKASRELQLDLGLVRRVWYGYGIGPLTYPVIYNAWCGLYERRTAESAKVIAFPTPLERLMPPHKRRPVKKRRVG